jgi:hypothetical protein
MQLLLRTALTLAALCLVPSGLPAQGSLTSAGALPHFATGGGWRTTWVIVNSIGSTSGSVRLNFIGDDGNPVAIPLTNSFAGQVLTPASSFSAPVPAHSMVVVYSEASSPISTGGWTQVSTDSSTTSVFEIFRYRSLPTAGGSVNVQQGVSTTQNASVVRYVVPFSEIDTAYTAIAIANLSASQITPSIRIRDNAGNTLATDTLPLAALGHTAFLVSKYPITAGIAGVLEVQTEAPGQITVVGLAFDSSNDSFFSLPGIGVSSID